MGRTQEGRYTENTTRRLKNTHTSTLVSIVTPTGGFRVGGEVNGKALSFLIDTGAAVTLIHKDAWDNMQHGQLELVGVDGSPLTVQE